MCEMVHTEEFQEMLTDSIDKSVMSFRLENSSQTLIFIDKTMKSDEIFFLVKI